MLDPRRLFAVATELAECFHYTSFQLGALAFDRHEVSSAFSPAIEMRQSLIEPSVGSVILHKSNYRDLPN